MNTKGKRSHKRTKTKQPRKTMPKKRHRAAVAAVAATDVAATDNNNDQSFPPSPGDSPHCIHDVTGSAYLDWSILALKKLNEESFWLDNMTMTTFFRAVRESRSTKEEVYDMAYDEFETLHTTYTEKTEDRVEAFVDKSKLIRLLITGEPYASHYQVLVIDKTMKEVTLIEQSSKKPLDGKQYGGVKDVLVSLGWSKDPQIFQRLSFRNKGGAGDRWKLFHVQAGKKNVSKEEETPLCGPFACNVYHKLLCTQEQNENNFRDPKWYDDLFPENPIQCRNLMVLKLKQLLPAFVLKCSQSLGGDDATKSKLEYATKVLGMPDERYEEALKTDVCQMCFNDCKGCEYVFVGECCGKVFHPLCFIRGCMSQRLDQHRCCPLCRREDVRFGVVEVKSMATVEIVKFDKDPFLLYSKVLSIAKKFDKSRTYSMEALKLTNVKERSSSGRLDFNTCIKMTGGENKDGESIIIAKSSFILDTDSEKDDKLLEQSSCIVYGDDRETIDDDDDGGEHHYVDVEVEGGGRLPTQASLLCNNEVQTRLDTMQTEAAEAAELEQVALRRQRLREAHETVSVRRSAPSRTNPLSDPSLSDGCGISGCGISGSEGSDDSGEDSSVERVPEPVARGTVRRSAPTSSGTVRRSAPTGSGTVRRSAPTGSGSECSDNDSDNDSGEDSSIERVSEPGVRGTVRRSAPSGSGTVRRSAPSGSGTVRRSAPSGSGTVTRSAPTGSGSECSDNDSGEDSSVERVSEPAARGTVRRSAPTSSGTVRKSARTGGSSSRYKPDLGGEVCSYRYPKMFSRTSVTVSVFRFGSLLFATETKDEADDALRYMKAALVPPGDANIPCFCGERFESMIQFCYHVSHRCIPIPSKLEDYAMENVPVAFVLRSPTIMFLKCIADLCNGMCLDILDPKAMPSNTYWITTNKEVVYERSAIAGLEKKVNASKARRCDIVDFVDKKIGWISKYERSGLRDHAFHNVLPGLISCPFLYPNDVLVQKLKENAAFGDI